MFYIYFSLVDGRFLVKTWLRSSESCERGMWLSIHTPLSPHHTLHFVITSAIPNIISATCFPPLYAPLVTSSHPMVQKMLRDAVLNFTVPELTEYIAVCTYFLRLSGCRGSNFICHNEWRCWGSVPAPLHPWLHVGTIHTVHHNTHCPACPTVHHMTHCTTYRTLCNTAPVVSSPTILSHVSIPCRIPLSLLHFVITKFTSP